jgi:hypothetical protein
MVAPIIWGGIGAAIILIAYLTELFEHISPENRYFLLANIIGSAILVYYSWLLDSMVFIILNAVWTLGSLYELWKLGKGRPKR